jgi:hypothetical protein
VSKNAFNYESADLQGKAMPGFALEMMKRAGPRKWAGEPEEAYLGLFRRNNVGILPFIHL